MKNRLGAITAFQLTTAAPEMLTRFYVEGLGFVVAEHSAIPPDEMALIGLSGAGRRVILRLGTQFLHLDSFGQSGRPYPSEAKAADRCFQHLAIVTSDAALSWERAHENGAIAISKAGPVTLPASSGGVTAIKFRDPEGHPLELLQFQAGTNGRWQGKGTLGVDHSAISVADMGRSSRFYEDWGLSIRGPTLNEGPAQDALDGLSGVSVDVVPMVPENITPHLELLGYRTPLGNANDGPLKANDIAATRIVWTANEDAFLRDPDGHLHLLQCS